MIKKDNCTNKKKDFFNDVLTIKMENAEILVKTPRIWSTTQIIENENPRIKRN